MASTEEMLDDVESAKEVSPKRGGLAISNWESEFIDSIREQFDDRGTLTEKQKNVLRKIWDRI